MSQTDPNSNDVIVIPRVNESSDPNNPSASQPRVVTLSRGTRGLGIPLILGKLRVPAIKMTPPVDVFGKMVCAYAWGLGKVKSISSVKFDGTAIGSLTGVSIETFLGNQTTMSSLLKSAYPITTGRTIAYFGVQHRGIAYSAIGVEAWSDSWGGHPDLEAVVEGMEDVYDPRTGTSGYSENPALHALYIMRSTKLPIRLPDSEIDMTSVSAAADFCDALISGVKRYYGGVYIPNRQQARMALNQILGQAQLFDVWHLGKWGLGFYDSTRAAALTVDQTYLASTEPPQESSTDADKQFTIVRCNYCDETRGWEDMIQTAGSDVYSGAAANEWVAQASGIRKASVAIRLADDIRRESQACRRLPLYLDERALELKRGDNVITKDIGIDGLSIDATLLWDEGSVASGGAIRADSNGPYITLSSSSGTWTSRSYDTSKVGTVQSSVIAWGSTTPSGSSVTVQVSTDGGGAWSSCTNGSSIPGFTPGSAAPSSLLVKVSMSASGSYPTVREIRVSVVTAGTTWRVLEVSPELPGRCSVLLGQPFVRSTLTDTVSSTGGATFNRVEARNDPAKPDSLANPGPPTSLVLTTVEAEEAGHTVYKIHAAWNAPSTAFVNGYRIVVTAGGKTVSYGPFERTCTETTFDAIAVYVSHSVTVYSISKAGKESSVTGSITPGPSAPSVSLSSITPYRRAAIIQQHTYTGQEIVSGWHMDIGWSVTGSDSVIDYYEVALGSYGRRFKVMGGGARSIRIVSASESWPVGLASWGDTYECHHASFLPGTSVQVHAHLIDGRWISSGASSVPSSCTTVGQFSCSFPSNDIAGIHPNQTKAVRPIVGSSPANGDSPWFKGGSYEWIWSKSWNGHANYSSFVWDSGNNAFYYNITFPTAHRSAPRITLGPYNSADYWVSNVTASGFTLWTNAIALSGQCYGECDWMSEDPKP